MNIVKKIFSLVLAFIFLFAVRNFQLTLHAQEQFAIDSNVVYKVEAGGQTLVTHDITLENLYSDFYATSYTLSLQNINANNPKAYDNNGDLNLDVKNETDKTTLKVTFRDAVVGKGKIRHFFITYQEDSFASRTGEVWEISVPKLSNENSFRNYSVTLNVPLSFGLEAYISPKPQSSFVSDGSRVYTFDKSDVIQTGIVAGFGEFQVFSFDLSYHLENPLNKRGQTQIAIPPDTSFQKVYYSKLNPKPKKISIDKDGNWIATYELGPRQRVDVKASGDVQIFTSFRPFPKPSQDVLNDNLKPSAYWQVDDPKIIDLANTLKTPKAIYNYVRTHLTYNIDRVAPNVERLGALGALENPKNAICMEFTDLFIAIARAAGIPAREVNGYAYTENPDVQPLGLVSDVLHSWPEYWDSQKEAWIAIDPTWAQTTGGVDYFDKLDLRHFTFVIHGEDSQKPYPPGSYKLGPNPQKDVYVTFGTLPPKRTSTPEITAQITKQIPFFNTQIRVSINNPGPVALYKIYPTYYFDNNLHARDYIEALPPYSTYQTTLNVPYSFLGKNTPDKVKIVVDGSQISLPTNKTQTVIASFLAISAVFILIIIFVLVKTKKINPGGIIAKIKNVFTKKPNKKSS